MKKIIWFAMGAGLMYLFNKYNGAEKVAPYLAAGKDRLKTKFCELKEKVDEKLNINEED